MSEQHNNKAFVSDELTATHLELYKQDGKAEKSVTYEEALDIIGKWF